MALQNPAAAVAAQACPYSCHLHRRNRSRAKLRGVRPQRRSRGLGGSFGRTDKVWRKEATPPRSEARRAQVPRRIEGEQSTGESRVARSRVLWFALQQ